MGRRQFEPSRGVDIEQQTISWVDSKIGMMPSESVEFVDASQTSNVNSGTDNLTTIRSSSGYLYDILGLLILVSAPYNGSSGTHSVTVKSETEHIKILEGKSAYDSNIYYRFGHWAEADSNQDPANEITQMEVIRGLRIDSSNGLKIRYSNDTDVTAGGTRKYTLWVRKIRVS